MTDSEKELRRKATECIEARRPDDEVTGRATDEHTYFEGAATPEAVLALLDRIEALEKQAGEAERKGAEEMREAVFDLLYRRGLKEDSFGRETLERAMRELDVIKPSGDVP